MAPMALVLGLAPSPVTSSSPSQPVPVTAALGSHRGIDFLGASWRHLLSDSFAFLCGIGHLLLLGESGETPLRRPGPGRGSFACVVLTFTTHTESCTYAPGAQDTVEIKTWPLFCWSLEFNRERQLHK